MSVAVVGEALIDFISDDDGAYRPHPGGSPFNVAIGLARQGIDVGYLSPLSDDPFGVLLGDTLAKEGVATPLGRRSSRPTSLALVAIDGEGMPTYRFYREGVADTDITAGEIDAALPADTTVLHTGSLALTPDRLPTLRDLLQRMRERGVAVSIDVNVRLGVCDDTDSYVAGVRSLLPLADIVKASDEDLDALGFHRGSTVDAELAFERMGGGMLVFTAGRRGARLIDARGSIERPAFTVKRLADTVGAGDTFHAAFLAALVRIGGFGRSGDPVSLEPLGDALSFAAAAAAINVSREGCSPPSRAETEAFIASQRGR